MSTFEARYGPWPYGTGDKIILAEVFPNSECNKEVTIVYVHEQKYGGYFGWTTCTYYCSHPDHNTYLVIVNGWTVLKIIKATGSQKHVLFYTKVE